MRRQDLTTITVVILLIVVITTAGCLSQTNSNEEGVNKSGEVNDSERNESKDERGGKDRNENKDGSSEEDRNGKENESGDGEDDSNSENRGSKEKNTSAYAVFVVDGQRHKVSLEVADTPSERSKGLMYRKSLEEDHGMVFVYSNEEPRTFWMKNTLIPLDMIFINSERKVINVEHAKVQPNASNSELKRYRSDAPAKYVIEVNRGYANETGIKKGTKVEIYLNSSNED